MKQLISVSIYTTFSDRLIAEEPDKKRTRIDGRRENAGGAGRRKRGNADNVQTVDGGIGGSKTSDVGDGKDKKLDQKEGQSVKVGDDMVPQRSSGYLHHDAALAASASVSVAATVCVLSSHTTHATARSNIGATILLFLLIV